MSFFKTLSRIFKFYHLLLVMEDDEYKNLKTSDIIAEALIDWNIDVVFGLPDANVCSNIFTDR